MPVCRKCALSGALALIGDGIRQSEAREDETSRTKVLRIDDWLGASSLYWGKVCDLRDRSLSITTQQ